ncbi:hypothetical protein K431DRAFT_241092 [Polychaeton citri CBS 116435]|uniref:Zn(2)-C6 fungal-type domain-containing protein n=1 Tax=Polychaeton citri CBS 116435 TaxID=1314669 RepID=A0A9P4QE83_9PEZI|nr:hypothetical protein K431DRAFT_241092 [Polychaeton citri CBS 116435]
MELIDSEAPKRSVATRTSLACLPCRSRHLKCDSRLPQCSRCAESAKQCQYAKSRRGGLDRATLAERRKQIAATREDPLVGDLASSPGTQVLPSPQRGTYQNQRHAVAPSFIQQDDGPPGWESTTTLGSSGGASPSTPQFLADDIGKDSLINSYYTHFHRFHPFVLPKDHLVRLYQDANYQSCLGPLIAVLRFIGYLYRSQKWSSSLKDAIEVSFSAVTPTGPFMVQCRLLYSIALFWYGFKVESSHEMNAAIELALKLRMFLREFTDGCETGDAVMTESWRRTWWTLYIVDAYYVGTLGTMKFAFMHIEPTVDLPCEEIDYEAGNIPEPRSLSEFDCREFADGDTSFSSFAYLIGAVRCASLAICSAPKVSAEGASPQVIEAADATIDGWLLLLPKGQKQVMSKSGEIDELMFQAHLLIHVATIGLHRPLSDLKFNAVEDVSTCAREPPPEIPTPELVNVHTVRVMKSVEAQIRLLALPSRPFNHTPFATCMLSEGTLALLSACRFILADKKLAIARDQIRMTLGCLKTLGTIWPRTAKNVREIQIIARHALQLDDTLLSRDAAKPQKAPSLSGSDIQAGTGLESATPNSNVFAAIGSMDDACTWYDIEDLDAEFSWFANELLHEV